MLEGQRAPPACVAPWRAQAHTLRGRCAPFSACLHWARLCVHSPGSRPRPLHFHFLAV